LQLAMQLQLATHLQLATQLHLATQLQLVLHLAMQLQLAKDSKGMQVICVISAIFLRFFPFFSLRLWSV